jgi:hypothetical protein
MGRMTAAISNIRFTLIVSVGCAIGLCAPLAISGAQQGAE